jgi:peptidoglycan/LPS O-acetylase OafA/YrhL
MTKALSLYLDGLRFVAAFTVFLAHYSVQRISGGFFWPSFAYGHTAVLVFFVLSGFVIAWVTETREHGLEDYVLSRAARLYSVIIPAFIITAVLNSLGESVDPQLYGAVRSEVTTHPFLGYALSAVFLGQSWTLDLLPGSNVPYWSLDYEAWYYVIFAGVVFLRGWCRIAALGAAALLAGPKILVLLPIWLMGAAAWQWRAKFPRRLAAPLIVGSLTVWIVLEAIGGQQLFQHANSPWLPSDCTGYDYLLGGLVTLLIVGLANTELPMPGLRFERLVRSLAATTFGLYLLHFPLLNFFAAIIPGAPDQAIRRILIFVFALGTALAVAWFVEPRKTALKRWLRTGLDNVLGRRPTSGLDRQPLT